MRFCDALQIKKGVTAFVGSGGKTGTIMRLAAELSEAVGVIITTTTHIFPQKPFAEQAFSRVSGILSVGTPAENGKIAAPRQRIATLAQYADYVLVEADGSKQLPIKAHAPYEPVIPPEAERVITVVGATGLNRPIAEVVHRPQIFSALSGEQTLATPQAVAEVLMAEGLADCVLINQCETPECYAAARTLAALLPKQIYLASARGGIIECLS